MSETEGGFQVRERRRFVTAAEESDGGTGGQGEGGTGGQGDKASAMPEQPGSSESEKAPEPGPAQSEGQPTSGASDSSAASPTDVQEDEGEHEHEHEQAGMPEITVSGVLQFTMASLSQMAWQNMGLLAGPSTGKLERKLPEARMAIDGFAALLPVISSELQDRDKRELHTLLSNLRLNYLEQQKRKE